MPAVYYQANSLSAFSRIPKDCVLLDTQLPLKIFEEKKEDLIKAFTYIPNTVTRFDLSFNNSYTDINIPDINAGRPIPPSYGKLKNGEALENVFTLIPSCVTLLQLGWNFLGDVETESLVKAIQKIPGTVKRLDLKCNNFGKKGKELKKIFAAIPDGVTILDLRNNELEKLTAEELAQALAALPKSVTELCLSRNDFGKFTEEQLKKVFAAIPTGVTGLSLADNNIGDITEDSPFLFWLPLNVTTIHYSDTMYESDRKYSFTINREKLKENNPHFEKTDSSEKNNNQDKNQTKNTQTTKKNSATDEKTKNKSNLKKEEKKENHPDQNTETPQDINNIDRLLASIKEKAGFFREKAKTRGESETGIYSKAATAADELYATMKPLYKKYQDSNLDLQEFQIRASYILDNQQSIAQVYKKYNYDNENNKDFLVSEIHDLEKQRNNTMTLKTHREFKELIINLLAACLSLVIPYALASVYSKATKGHWTVFKPATKTGAIADELQKAIEEIKEDKKTPKK